MESVDAAPVQPDPRVLSQALGIPAGPQHGLHVHGEQKTDVGRGLAHVQELPKGIWAHFGIGAKVTKIFRSCKARKQSISQRRIWASLSSILRTAPKRTNVVFVVFP